MIFTGLVIAKTLLADHKLVKGYVEEINCHPDSKRNGVYLYFIKTSNDERFRNRLNIACDSISDIKIGDLIEVESDGHIFIQISHDDIDLFSKSELQLKKSGVSIIFSLLFILATCDVIYRFFFNRKDK